MPTKQALQDAFWKALDSDRTVMLGADGVYPRPMTAIAEDARGPIWFFTSIDTDIGQRLETHRRANGLMMLTSKGHDLFATVGGTLVADTDPEVVDRLWNPFIAAWYTGKDDPKLRLVRFDPDTAEIWENGSSLLAGIKTLLGVDPKKDYKDQAKRIRLRG